MANNKIQVKRTSTAGRTPNTTNAGNSQYIAAGELALNMTDKTFFTSDGTNLIYVGSNVVNQYVSNSVTIDNDKGIYWKTVNTSASVGMRQQNDDNFVFYSTNSTYGARAVYSIYANSNSSEFSFQVPVRFNANVTVITANGTQGATNQVLTSNGSTVYWSSPAAASVNVAAQYTWTNTQTFSANITFGNNIAFGSGNGIYFNAISDGNWRIGRNTGGVGTKFFYTGNTMDIIAANSALEGIAFGYTGNTYLETGYAGTFTRNPIYVGNTVENVVTTNTTLKIQTNTTVNSTMTAALVQVSNSTSTANLTALDLKIGATTTVNSIQVTATTLVGNLSGSYVNVSGQVNTATLYATTSANIASAVQANATGVWTTGTVNGATHSVGTAFTANSTVVNAVSYYSGTLLVANTTVINATHLAGYNWSAPPVLGSTTANGASLTYANVSGAVNAASLLLSTNVATIGTGTYFVSNGNVGIGTSTPSDKFQVYGTTSVDFSSRVDSATAGDRPSFRFIHTGGSLTTQTPAGARLGLISFLGVNDTAAVSTYAYIDSFLEGTANSTANSYIKFVAATGGTASEIVRITGNSVLINAVVNASSHTVGAYGATTNGSIVNNTILATGNSSVNAVINSSAFALNGIVAGGFYKGNSSNTVNPAAAGNIFRVNSNTLTASVTFAAGENGTATGPVAVAPGISLIIQTGARVSIV